MFLSRNSVSNGVRVDSSFFAKADLSRGDMVSWSSYGSRARGKIVRIIREGTLDVPDSSFKIKADDKNPAVLIRIYRDDKPTDVLVGHRMDTLRMVSKANPYHDGSGRFTSRGRASSVNNDLLMERGSERAGRASLIVNNASVELERIGEVGTAREAKMLSQKIDFARGVSGELSQNETSTGYRRTKSLTQDLSAKMRSSDNPAVVSVGNQLDQAVGHLIAAATIVDGLEL
jgi:hypothetical protein